MKRGPKPQAECRTGWETRCIGVIHKAVAIAVDAQILVANPCEACGVEPVEFGRRATVQAHHDDYSRPIDVRWLCRSDHVKWHRNNRAKPPLKWMDGKTARELMQYGVLQGKNPDADSLAKLVHWCGIDFKHLIAVDGK